MSPEAPPGQGDGATGATVLSGLDAASAKQREDAVRALIPPLSSELVIALAGKLRTDPNANVRRTVAEMLGNAGDTAVEPLVAALRDTGEETFVRAAAARALGTSRADAGIEPLGHALSSAADLPIKMACLEALGRIGTPRAVAVIGEMLTALTPSVVRGRAVVLLAAGDGAGDVAFEAVSGLIVREKDPKVVKAAMTALADSWPDRADSLLTPFLTSTDPALRRRAAESIRNAAPSITVIRALVAAALLDPDPDVREAAAATAATVGQSTALVESLVEICRDHHLGRSTVDEKALANVTKPIATGDEKGRAACADALLSACIDADDRVTGLLVLVLVHCCGRDVSIAGIELNRFATARPDLAERLTAVRVELGGQQALDPIMRQLSADLERYFQKPVYELNQKTVAGWQAAVERARFAFGVRVAMSIVVFGVGIVLTAVSVVLWLSGREEPAALWGAGASLVSGLTAMLTVTYSGPLRDVRQSMHDLGASTAAFIGFVHRISQISHTFTGLYLRQQISLEEVSESSRLIRDATRDTVALLGDHGTGMTTAPGADSAKGAQTSES